MNKIQNISFSVKSYTTPGNIHPSLQHVLSVYFDKNIHPCEYSLIINYDSLDHVEIEQLKFIKIIKDNFNHVVHEILSQYHIINLKDIMSNFIQMIENDLLSKLYKR